MSVNWMRVRRIVWTHEWNLETNVQLISLIPLIIVASVGATKPWVVFAAILALAGFLGKYGIFIFWLEEYSRRKPQDFPKINPWIESAFVITLLALLGLCVWRLFRP